MDAVLLLNVTYEPLAVISARRAVSLLLRDKVDAVTDDSVRVSGIADTVHIPTVIRLRYYIKVPQRGAKYSRRAILQRDQYQCIYCGIRIGEWQKGHLMTKQSFTVDHIVPRSRGGLNNWSNTACACAVCNNRKGARMPHEAGMTLRWEPKIPRVNYLIASGEIPSAWKIYLKI